MSFFAAGSGRSMSRLLMAFFVGCVGISLVLVAWKSGAISAPWAAVATGVTTSLAGVWGVGKWRSKVGVAAPSASGASGTDGGNQ